MKKFLFIFLFYMLTSISFTCAQGVYVPVYHSVYEFLERMDTKGVIDYSKVIKPQTRKELATFLELLEKKVNQLNNIEKKELSWYLKEFYYEQQLLKLLHSSLYPTFY